MKKINILLLTMLLSYTGFLAAAPPESSEAKGLPRYLESEFALIKGMLEVNAQKMDALSAQLDGVKTELKAEIFSAKQEINGRIDILAADVDEVMDILAEPDKDIQLTTEVCFDLAASWAWELTTKASLGVGWDSVVKIDAFGELSGPGPLIIPSLVPLVPPIVVPFVVPGVAAGVGGNLCVNVPLYSVASNDYWTANFDTDDFDALVAGAAMPAQYLLPGLANLYGKVVDDVTPAVEFLNAGFNVIVPDPGMTQTQAITNAAVSFGHLMESPMFETMFKSIEDQSADWGWALDLIDPLCEFCWILPH